MTRAVRGFTLVEVLVATALLSLVVLGLLTAMRSFAQSEERIDARIRVDDDLRVSDRFLRTVLSSVSPRQREAAAGAPKAIDFAGSEREMRWIGVMPARHGAGGLYRFHLFSRPAGAELPAAVVLEFHPYVPGFEAPLEPAALQSRTMVAGAGEARFRYQDDGEAGEAWLADWPHADRLPQRVGLTVEGADHPWPEMVVSVVAVTGAAAGRGGVAAGPAVGPR
jgi:general secretion pathway protein J